MRVSDAMSSSGGHKCVRHRPPVSLKREKVEKGFREFKKLRVIFVNATIQSGTASQH